MIIKNINKKKNIIQFGVICLTLCALIMVLVIITNFSPIVPIQKYKKVQMTGVIGNYMLIDTDKNECLQETIYGYREMGSCLFVVGTSGYTVVNEETGTIEQSGEILIFSKEHRKIFMEKDKFIRLGFTEFEMLDFFSMFVIVFGFSVFCLLLMKTTKRCKSILMKKGK